MPTHRLRSAGLVTALAWFSFAGGSHAAAPPTPPQPGQVRGRLVACNGAPLPNATTTITVVGTGVGAITDADGEFLVSVPAGTSTLRFQTVMIGYSNTLRDVSVSVAQGEIVDLGLIPVDCDHVRLRSSDPSDQGVFLFDGRVDDGGGSGFTCVDDRITLDTGGRGSAVLPIPVNVSAQGTCHSSVAYFSRSTAAFWEPSPPDWGPQIGDVVDRELAARLDVPLHIWLAVDAGSLNTAQILAEASAADAQDLYGVNRMGLAFTWDVDTVTTGSTAIGNSCGAASLNLSGTSWYEAGKVNVYVVAGLHAQATATSPAVPLAGKNCDFDRNVIMVDLYADQTTLAHELGHAFGFRCGTECFRSHTDLTYTVDVGHGDCPTPDYDKDPLTPFCQPAACPSGFPIVDASASDPGCQPFSRSNIMWPEVVGRSTFTVGQAYHIRVEAASQLRVNGQLSGPSRACASQMPFETLPCPLLWLDP